MLTLEEVKAAMPGTKKKLVTQSVVDKLNLIASEDEAGNFAQQIITHASVMKSGPWSLDDYINAVRYVGYRLMEFNKKDSFSHTFPEKVKKWEAKGMDYNTMAKYMSAYNSNQLVNDIYDRALIPVHILNAGMFQEALNTQAHLMVSAKSEMVRTTAANSILTHLKAPVESKLTLDITTNSTDSVQELQETMALLAQKQVDMIASGQFHAKEVAEMKIIKDEVIDVEVE